MSKRYFITGTGTGVGKTFVTAVLNRHLQEQGKKVLVVKPAQTGAVHLPSEERISCDIRFVENYAKDPLLLSQAEACFYLYDLPASPHLSVKAEHQEVAELVPEISMDVIIEKLEELEEKYQPDYTLVEGAGGLFVPLNSKHEMMIDLIGKLNCESIVVASATLGTLNHSLLSMEALASRQLPVKALCLNGYDETHIIAEDNYKTLQSLVDCQIFTLPELPEFDTESDDKIEAIEVNLGELSL